MMKEQGTILRFWRDIEIFTIPSPATYKDQTRPPDKGRQSTAHQGTQPNVTVKKYEELEKLPWPRAVPDPSTDPVTQAKYVEYAIYLGVQDMRPLAEMVMKAVAPAAELNEKDFENLSGQGYLGIFCANKNGVPLAGTYTAASFVLGVEAYLKGANLDKLTQSLDDARKSFDERRFALKLVEEPDYGETTETEEYETEMQEAQPEEKPEQPHLPLTWRELREECQILFDCLGLALPKKITITIKTTEMPAQQDDKKNKKEQPQPIMLNSFYLSDLTNLIRQCDQNEPFGRTLSAYLGKPSAKGSRRDILKDPTAMLGMLDPVFLPSGRWPSCSKNHLMLGQQASVSGILARVTGEKGGLVAVNGPPGTGKTTLLSDIIAEVVVRRAENICKYDKPWRIFDAKRTPEGSSCSVYPLKKDVARNTGIIVSSNNNSAVKNITLELPSISKIASKEHPGAEYFSDVIKGIFSRSENPSKSWGLIAGALGNKENRKVFFDGFIWGSRNKNGKGMKNLLAAIPKDDLEREKKWHVFKEEFLSLKSRIDAQKKEYSEYYQAMRLRPRLQELRRQLSEADAHMSRLQLDKESCQACIEKARLDKPGILHRLLGSFGLKTQSYLAWERPQKEVLQNLQANLEKQKEVQTRKEALLSEQAHLEIDLGRQESKEDSMRQNFGPIPDEQFFAHSQEAQHLSHVWTTDAFNLLRSQFFMAALKLHEATILACSGKFSANFNALKAMLIDQGYFPQEVRAALWDSLFFTVPVISTTLASFDKLFSGMGQESIGWLLIDEAGQATPQSVVGALWRSQRAVVIGDPLQIEPVLTIPEQLVVHIQRKYDLKNDWSPKLHSAQTLADRTMDVGAWIGSGETAVWTGLPLRAHRRCVEPMFSVSNHIAYDDQMVQANTSPDNIESCLGQSKWFDVQATDSDGQVVQAELAELKNLLKKLQQDWPMVSGEKKASVYIISPFRRVAAECRRMVDSLKLDDHIHIQAGTVHTFQGKEADIVFIVLGSAPGSAGAGSRNWASEKPNLLNVALTRAKLRVYVIGNRDDWKICRGFDKLADTLEKNHGSESA
jgi:hypothetical protein